MATLSFEGETHGELVVKVRRWLASLEGEEEGHLSRAEAVEQGAELTKEALRVIAAAAPQPIAQSEVVKALTGMGYKATDSAKEAIIDGLDSVEEMTGGQRGEAGPGGREVGRVPDEHAPSPGRSSSRSSPTRPPEGGRMRVRNMVVLAVVVAGVGLVAAPAAPAGADVVTPPGACRGSGIWVRGRLPAS